MKNKAEIRCVFLSTTIINLKYYLHHGRNKRTMNADFLAMLGGGSGPSSASTRRDEGKSIVKFKAGKMIAERKEVGCVFMFLTELLLSY